MGKTVKSTWVRLSKPATDELRIFFFPYSGGTAQVFRPWAGMFPAGVGIFAFEPPGRGRRFGEAPHDNLAAMTAETVEGFIPLITGDYLLFGHSIGGLLAFEMARELRRRAFTPPRHVFVSGTRAPQIPRPREQYYNLPSDEFVEKIKILGGIPQEVLDNKELLDLMLPILRKDFQAYETYTYQDGEPLACPITAFGGAQDQLVGEEHLKQWAEQTSVIFSYYLFDGGHFYLHNHYQEIVNAIRQNMLFLRPQ